MRFLVTGGAGFIGSHLAESLEEAVIYDIVKPKEKIEAEFVKGDILDKNALASAAKDCDAIFHLAAQTSVLRSVEMPAQDFEVNVLGTLNVLEVAKELGTKVIYTSSCAPYGDAQYLPVDERHPLTPKSPYAASKMAGEKMAMAYWHSYGLEATALRLFNVYGPRQAGGYAGVVSIFLRAAKEGKKLTIFGDGNQFRDFVYVKDVVEAFRLAEKKGKGGEVFNIGTGKKTTVNDIADMVLEATGSKSRVIHEAEKKGESSGIFADISLAQKRLGFKPKVELREGIQKTCEWVNRL